MFPPPTIQHSLAKRPVDMLAFHFLRASQILDAARQPITCEDLTARLSVPMSSLYRHLRALTRLGWLRVIGYKMSNRGRPSQVYITVSEHVLPYPRLCPDCHTTLHSHEAEEKHRSQQACRIRN